MFLFRFITKLHVFFFEFNFLGNHYSIIIKL
jgi:hypothetical protein